MLTDRFWPIVLFRRGARILMIWDQVFDRLWPLTLAKGEWHEDGRNAANYGLAFTFNASKVLDCVHVSSNKLVAIGACHSLPTSVEA